MIQAPPPVIPLAVESSAESEPPRQAVIGNSLDSFNVVKPNRTNRPVRRLASEPASNQAKPARQAARLGSVATAARLQIKSSGKGKQESWTVKTTTKPSTKGSKQTSFRVRVSDVGFRVCLVFYDGEGVRRERYLCYLSASEWKLAKRGSLSEFARSVTDKLNERSVKENADEAKLDELSNRVKAFV